MPDTRTTCDFGAPGFRAVPRLRPLPPRLPRDVAKDRINEGLVALGHSGAAILSDDLLDLIEGADIDPTIRDRLGRLADALKD